MTTPNQPTPVDNITSAVALAGGRCLATAIAAVSAQRLVRRLNRLYGLGIPEVAYGEMYALLSGLHRVTAAVRSFSPEDRQKASPQAFADARVAKERQARRAAGNEASAADRNVPGFPAKGEKRI